MSITGFKKVKGVKSESIDHRQPQFSIRVMLWCMRGGGESNQYRGKKYFGWGGVSYGVRVFFLCGGTYGNNIGRPELSIQSRSLAGVHHE